jgi:ubiquitin-protein ligase
VDEILKSFLKTQHEEGLQLAAESDLLELMPVDAQRYLAIFSCKGLIRDAKGDIHEHDRFEIGIRFPDDYLRRANPAVILTWLAPDEIYHPNIEAPYICLGSMMPGTPLVELLHRCFEIITFENVTMREDDALNRDACAWSRRNRRRFPIDPRPIKRRALESSLEFMEVGP